jgi:DNA-binding MarR family transcriptional regulator
MFHTALAAHQGLSASEEKTLDLLDRHGPLTAGDLGRHAGLAPASVTGLVDRLERKGFAHRLPDPQDGRRVLIAPDPARIARLAPLFTDFVRELEELFATFSTGELETILRFMQEAARRQRAATQRRTDGEAHRDRRARR